MKRWIKALLSGAVIAALTIAMLAGLTDLTERKDSDFKYEPFLAQDADFDVLFLGTSHVINGVFPMELWEDYGIVSYNFGGHSTFMPMAYWVMRNALQYTTPKLVVVDSLFLESKVKVHPDFSLNHLSLDAFPLSEEKIRGAFDLLDDEVYDQFASASGMVDRTRSKLDLLWDFAVYHDRWTELGEEDFSPRYTLEKGAETRVNVASPPPAELTEEIGMPENVSTEYLRRIIEECQEQGIGVLLTYLPFPASESEYKWANTAREIAQEYGVGYIDFLQTDTVDFATDCYDEDSHLNPSGARKVTDYLGRYIREHYDVPDRRDDPAYEDWNGDYAEYTQFKIDTLAAQTDAKNYLMLLQDRHMSSILCLAPGELWQGDGVYGALLDNIGVDSGALSPDSPTLAVVDNTAGQVTYLSPGMEADTSFGHIAFDRTDGAYQALLDGTAELTLEEGQTLAAAVVDNGTGQVVTSSQFSASTEVALFETPTDAELTEQP